MINIANIIDPKKFYEEIRRIRWKDGLVCPRYEGCDIKKSGFGFQNIYKRNYKCKSCKKSLMT